jgi:NAD(P)-dependent dehydrogenase (short-subunit alcohol dehydrogenase family)
MNKEAISSMFSLEGKTALITGASRGIGEEIARVFALAGAKLVISSRKQQSIEEAAQRIREKTSAEILAVTSNISHTEDRQKLVKAAIAWAGRVDILVNNAGTNPAHSPLESVTESAWDKIFEVNLKGPLFLSQLVFSAWMKNHGGCIINTASAGAYKYGGGTEAAYCITKSAVVHLTKCLAGEWAKYHIRVNAIGPGLIKTRMAQALWDRPGIEELVKDRATPRLGEVEDIAGAALLLASKAGEFINGHAVVVDNGSLIE